jgi:hypothetical protein
VAIAAQQTVELTHQLASTAAGQATTSALLLLLLLQIPLLLRWVEAPLLQLLSCQNV